MFTGEIPGDPVLQDLRVSIISDEVFIGFNHVKDINARTGEFRDTASSFNDFSRCGGQIDSDEYVHERLLLRTGPQVLCSWPRRVSVRRQEPVPVLMDHSDNQ
jgi:hypothetical protein